MPRPSVGRLCPARKPSGGAGLMRLRLDATAAQVRRCHLPTAPGTVRSSSTTCSTPTRLRLPTAARHGCGNSTRAMPRPRGALLGQFRHLHTDIYGNRERKTPSRELPDAASLPREIAINGDIMSGEGCNSPYKTIKGLLFELSPPSSAQTAVRGNSQNVAK